METTGIPDTAAIEQRSATIFEHADRLVVECAEDEERAGLFLRQIKTLRGQIAELFDGPIKRAYEAHRAILDARKTIDGAPEMAEGVVKDKIADYSDYERKRVAKEQAEQRAESYRRERLRLDEVRYREIEAKQLRAQGKGEEAKQVIATPIVEPSIPAAAPRPKVAGVSERVEWKHRVTEASLVPPQFRIIDHKGLAAYARSHKEHAKVAGVLFYPETIVSAKAM